MNLPFAGESAHVGQELAGYPRLASLGQLAYVRVSACPVSGRSQPFKVQAAVFQTNRVTVDPIWKFPTLNSVSTSMWL